MEDFKERNRLRRQQNAFDNLRAYAERTGIKNPETAAEKAAQEIHGGDGDGPVAGTSARAKRVAAKKAGAASGAAAGGKKATGKKAEAKTGGKKSAAAAAGKASKKPAAEKAVKKPAAKKAAAEKASKKPAADKAGKAGEKAAPAEGKSATGGKDDASLDDQTKDELYAMAQDLDIEGRSSMNKDELIEAIKTQK